MQPRVLGLVDHTHPAAAELLNDAVVRDGLADHAQACYGGSVGKSMKAGEVGISKKVVGGRESSGNKGLRSWGMHPSRQRGYLGCKQNLGHPVNDLFELRTEGRSAYHSHESIFFD